MTHVMPCQPDRFIMSCDSLQELACSLAASNPAARLVVLAAPGELASGTVKAVEAVATMRYAEPVFFESLSSRR